MLELLRDSNHYGLLSRHPVSSKLYFEAIKLSRQRHPDIKESGKSIKKLRDLLNRRNNFLRKGVCSCEFCEMVYKILGSINGLDV